MQYEDFKKILDGVRKVDAKADDLIAAEAKLSVGVLDLYIKPKEIFSEEKIDFLIKYLQTSDIKEVTNELLIEFIEQYIDFFQEYNSDLKEKIEVAKTSFATFLETGPKKSPFPQGLRPEERDPNFQYIELPQGPSPEALAFRKDLARVRGLFKKDKGGGEIEKT